MDGEFTYTKDTDIKDPKILAEMKRATKVMIMGGVTIPGFAFENYGLLREVEFSKIGEIKCDDSAFFGCGITQLELSPNVKLGSSVFRDCPDLAKVTIMEGVADIPVMTFYGCESLREVVFPKEGKIKCDTGAFARCGITKLVLSPNVVLDGAVFVRCPDLAEVTIMEGVSIPAGTFEGCNPIMTIYTDMPKEEFQQGFPGIKLQVVSINQLTQLLNDIKGSNGAQIPTAISDIMLSDVIGDMPNKSQSAGYLFTKKKYYDLVRGSDYF